MCEVKFADRSTVSINPEGCKLGCISCKFRAGRTQEDGQEYGTVDTHYKG